MIALPLPSDYRWSREICMSCSGPEPPSVALGDVRVPECHAEMRTGCSLPIPSHSSFAIAVSRVRPTAQAGATVRGAATAPLWTSEGPFRPETGPVKAVCYWPTGPYQHSAVASIAVTALEAAASAIRKMTDEALASGKPSESSQG
jgi:hypothetical protein